MLVCRDAADSLRDFYYSVAHNRVQGATNLMLEAWHWLRAHHPYWCVAGPTAVLTVSLVCYSVHVCYPVLIKGAGCGVAAPILPHLSTAGAAVVLQCRLLTLANTA